MKHKLTLSLVIPLLFGLVGCENDKTITGGSFNNGGRRIVGSGNVVTNEVQLPAFNRLATEIPADLKVTIGAVQSVAVKAQQNIYDVMVLRVANGQLHLELEDGISEITTQDAIEVIITAAAMNRVSATGVGDIELSGPKQQSIDFNITGVGNIDAYDLEVDSCNIVLTGVGSCRVHVNQWLDVTLTGSGSVSYRGNATVTSTIAGVGNVIKDD